MVTKLLSNFNSLHSNIVLDIPIQNKYFPHSYIVANSTHNYMAENVTHTYMAENITNNLPTIIWH